jgi:hypothetical protein
MSSIDTSPRDVKAIADRYKSIALFGGIFLGGVVGVMVVGPNFREWTGMRSLLTIVGSVGLGGLAGYLAGEIAVATLASGGGPGLGGGAGDGGVDGGGGSGDGGGGDGGGDS